MSKIRLSVNCAHNHGKCMVDITTLLHVALLKLQNSRQMVPSCCAAGQARGRRRQPYACGVTQAARLRRLQLTS